MPTESAYPRIDIPNVDIWTLLFENRNKVFPDDQLIYVDADTSRAYTFAQIKSTAIEFGKGLKSVWEWEKGDVLAFFTPNCIDTPPLIWGVHWSGGIVSPANPGYTAQELAFQLKDANAKAIVTQKPFLNIATTAAKSAGIPEDKIILIGDERDEKGKFRHFSSMLNLVGTGGYQRTIVDPNNDIAFLVYSSGTTGLPKGVMLSHFNIVSNILQLSTGEGENLSWDRGPDGKGDVLVGFLPFFHIYGLNCLVHQCLYSGLTLVVMSKFDIEKLCSNIQRYKITYAYVVPPVILLLGKHPVVEKYDLSSLRMLNSGAAPLSQELVEAVYKRVRIPIKQGYGLSETSPSTHTQTTKYMSPEDTEVALGETGELWIKGPNIFKGYHNNPEGTRNALTPDGYFKTGDVGYQDNDGNFFITDRVKELIKYKGFQVAPAELEGLLTSHPAINDVAVVGLHNHAQATEVPRAYVVLKDGVEASAEMEREIAQWLHVRVAHHKWLRGGVRFVKIIPKSASGKILRRVLKSQAAEEERKGKEWTKANL
ncbi:MAG: hypothetical protein Q9163_004955 [Psora crenata]